MLFILEITKGGEGDFERMVQKDMFVFLSDSGDTFFEPVL